MTMIISRYVLHQLPYQQKIATLSTPISSVDGYHSYRNLRGLLQTLCGYFAHPEKKYWTKIKQQKYFTRKIWQNYSFCYQNHSMFKKVGDGVVYRSCQAPLLWYHCLLNIAHGLILLSILKIACYSGVTRLSEMGAGGGAEAGQRRFLRGKFEAFPIYKLSAHSGAWTWQNFCLGCQGGPCSPSGYYH